MPNPLDYGKMVNALQGGGLLGNALAPQSGNGLLQPVVFDQFRSKKGVNALGGTEGARPYYGGSARSGGGFKVKSSGDPGAYTVTKKLRSGVEVEFQVYKNPNGTLEAEVMFSPVKSAQRGQRGAQRVWDYSGESAKPSTRQSLKRFSEVQGTIEEFVSKVRPGTLNFSAGSGNLQRFYDKIAPQIGKRLGGQYQSPWGGQYEFSLPNPAAYPLKKP